MRCSGCRVISVMINGFPVGTGQNKIGPPPSGVLGGRGGVGIGMAEWRRHLVSMVDVFAESRAALLGDDFYNLRYDLGSGSGESGSGLEPMPIDKSEWIFFGLLSFCDFFVLLLMLSSLGGFIRRLIDHRTTRTGRNDSHSRLRAALATQSMTVIVSSILQQCKSHSLALGLRRAPQTMTVLMSVHHIGTVLPAE